LNLINFSLALPNGCRLTSVLKLLNNSIQDSVNNLKRKWCLKQLTKITSTVFHLTFLKWSFLFWLSPLFYLFLSNFILGWSPDTIHYYESHEWVKSESHKGEDSTEELQWLEQPCIYEINSTLLCGWHVRWLSSR
jgi:hypothetical protein